MGALPEFRPIQVKDYLTDVTQLQQQQQLAPLETEAKRQQLQTETEAQPLARKAASQQSALADVQFGNDQLAQVAKDTLAADPKEAPSVFDRGMQNLADKGNPQAAQFVGHFDRAQQIADVYSGKAQAAQPQTPGFDQQAAYDQISKMTPDQRAKALSNQNAVIEGFNAVKTEADWKAELAKIQKLDPNLPIAQMFPASNDWRLNYAIAHQLIQKLTPIRDMMAQYELSSAMGAPAPQPEVPKNMLPNYKIAGYDANGQPIYYNTRNPADSMTGPQKVAPKQSAGAVTFNTKYNAWLAQNPGDIDGALQFANGKRKVEDSILREMALNQANKEYYAAQLSLPDNTDPDKWVKARAEENYKMMTQGAPSAPTAPRPGPPAKPGGGASIPQRAIDTVKAAGGKRVTFPNGKTYVWKNGRAEPVT